MSTYFSPVIIEGSNAPSYRGLEMVFTSWSRLLYFTPSKLGQWAIPTATQSASNCTYARLRRSAERKIDFLGMPAGWAST